MTQAWHFDPNDDDEYPTDNDWDPDDQEPPFDVELDFTYAHGMTILDHMDKIQDEDPDGEY